MRALLNNFRGMVNDERGVTALECGLVADPIKAGIIGSVTVPGAAVSTQFNNIAAAL
jgi:Flp pilus assembly pilin Flp